MNAAASQPAEAGNLRGSEAEAGVSRIVHGVAVLPPPMRTSPSERPSMITSLVDSAGAGRTRRGGGHEERSHT